MLLNSLKEIDKILDDTKSGRVLIVSGKNSYKSSGASEILRNKLANYTCYRYSDFDSNPKFEHLIQGAKLVADFKPDILLAVGGGSVLDTAKIVSILPSEHNAAIEVITQNKSSLKRKHSLIAVPTTAGSGSESTRFAVAYVDNKKYSLSNNTLLPDHVILDPSLTSSLSPSLTAVSGVDAFSQAIESFWAVGSTDESKNYARKSLKLLLDVFPGVVQNPTGEARYKMMTAAHFSGKAIDISRTTAPHAVSYTLTIKHNIQHGHAVALTLPQFFEYNLSPENFQDSNKNEPALDCIRKELLEIFKCKNISECRNKIESIIKNTGLEMRLSKLGKFSQNNVEDIVNNVNLERLSNNPRIISKEKMRDIIQNIM